MPFDMCDDDRGPRAESDLDIFLDMNDYRPGPYRVESSPLRVVIPVAAAVLVLGNRAPEATPLAQTEETSS